MNKKQKPETAAETFEQTQEFIASEANAFALKTVDQAQAAFDKAADLAHGNVQVLDAAASACKARFADLQLKAMEIAQANVAATLAHARKLFAVRQPAEFFSLQQDFARSQFQAFGHQAAELNQLSLALAKETAKPVQDSLYRSFGEFGKLATV